MNKLIVNIQPFTLNQRIDVFRDDNYETSIPCNFDSLVDTIVETARTYNCAKVTLKGTYNFTSRYAQLLKEDTNRMEFSKRFEIEVL